MRTKTKMVSIVAAVSVVMAIIRTVIIQYDMEKNDIGAKTYYLPDNAEVTVFTVAVFVFIALFAFCAVSFGRGQRIVLNRAYGAAPAGSLTLAFSLTAYATALEPYANTFAVTNAFTTTPVDSLLPTIPPILVLPPMYTKILVD